jgi:O-antigen ligase
MLAPEPPRCRAATSSMGRDPGRDEPATGVWRWLPLRLAIVALPFWFTTAALIFHIGWRTKLVVALVLGVTLATPAEGLLLAAALAPLGLLIATYVGDQDFRISDAVVAAFLVGWLLRALPDRRGPGVAAPLIGWLFAATVVASIAGLALQLRIYPDELTNAVRHLFYAFYYPAADRIGAISAVRLLEGIGLLSATVTLFRRNPSLAVRLPLVLAGSAAVAVISSVLLWYGVGSASALERFARNGYRVSGHVADVNAAGSYFAMIACLAVGMGVRARGLGRPLWLAVAGVTWIGLWLSASRSAFAAAAIVVAAALGWAATSRFTPRVRAAAFAAVLIVATGAGALRLQMLQSDPEFQGAEFREDFNATSVRMIAAAPLVGVGIGQYYRTSALFLSPQLGWSYGFENAHNNFLQIGAELGLVGLGTFAVWIGAAVARSARALLRAPRDARLLGATAGVIAFLGTWLTGHPLLVSETAFPFWIQLGLVTALAGTTLLNDRGVAQAPGVLAETPRPWPLVTAVVATAILVSAPLSPRRGPVALAESRAVDGFYQWETLEDGTRFRWTERYGSLFVPADVRRVQIPLRLPTSGRIRPMEVEIRTGGAKRGRTVVGDNWVAVEVALAEADPPIPFKRIDLKVDRVWVPALYIAGSGELRQVGVQVGELRLLRE